MGKALDRRVSAGTARDVATGRLDWRKRMSDNVAYALLVYTGVQIGVTMSMLKGSQAGILPYFALVLLVAAIIPACRLFEARWTDLSDDDAADPALAGTFARERAGLWLAALGLPFIIAALMRGVQIIAG